AVTGLLLAAIPVRLERPLHVPGDEQVEPSVVVVVEEARARAPAGAADAGAGGDVTEGAVAVVAVEGVATVTGDVEVLEAVVVVVARGHAHAVDVLRHSREPRPLRDVLESVVRLLVVEPAPESPVGPVRPRGGRHGIVELRAVREEYVEPADVVVVEDGHASAHRLQQVLARGGGVLVLEVDA